MPHLRYSVSLLCSSPALPPPRLLVLSIPFLLFASVISPIFTPLHRSGVLHGVTSSFFSPSAPPSVCKSFFRFKRTYVSKKAHQSAHFAFIPLRYHFIWVSTPLFHVKHSSLFAISPLFAAICPPKKRCSPSSLHLPPKGARRLQYPFVMKSSRWSFAPIKIKVQTTTRNETGEQGIPSKPTFLLCVSSQRGQTGANASRLASFAKSTCRTADHSHSFR